MADISNERIVMNTLKKKLKSNERIVMNTLKKKLKYNIECPVCGKFHLDQGEEIFSKLLN
jgi:hypothetical protein